MFYERVFKLKVEICDFQNAVTWSATSSDAFCPVAPSGERFGANTFFIHLMRFAQLRHLVKGLVPTLSLRPGSKYLY